MPGACVASGATCSFGGTNYAACLALGIFGQSCRCAGATYHWPFRTARSRCPLRAGWWSGIAACHGKTQPLRLSATGETYISLENNPLSGHVRAICDNARRTGCTVSSSPAFSLAVGRDEFRPACGKLSAHLNWCGSRGSFEVTFGAPCRASAGLLREPYRRPALSRGSECESYRLICGPRDRALPEAAGLGPDG